MTNVYIDDAKDDEPGFVAARLIASPRYTLGTPSGGVTTVGEHERLFDVAEDFGDGYCHECDVLLTDCHCFDGFEFGDYEQDTPSTFHDWDNGISPYAQAVLKAHHDEAKFALYSFLIAVFGSIALIVLTAH
jgi:hypothetical protein